MRKERSIILPLIPPIVHAVALVIHRLVQAADHLVVRPAIERGVHKAKERKKQRTQAANLDATSKNKRDSR